MSNDSDEPSAKRLKAEEPSTTCPICLNDVTEMSRALPCGHRFDKACIKSSLERDNRCPTCRDVIGELETDITPDGRSSKIEVRHPEEQESLIPPDATLRFLRSAEILLAELKVTQDASIVFQGHGVESVHPIQKDQYVYLPKVFTGAEGHRSLIRIPEQEDRGLVIPDDDSDDDDEDGEAAIVPSEAEVATTQSILRVLDFLRARLASAEGAAVSSDDGSDHEEGHEDASPSASPATSPGEVPVPDPVPLAAAEPQPPSVTPPDEEVSFTISPSVKVSFTYPKGWFVRIASTGMVILKAKHGDDETAQIIRSGSVVFLPAVFLRSHICLIKEAGKEYPLSQAFKDLLSSKDQVHGYRRDADADSDEEDDSSDDDEDDDV